MRKAFGTKFGISLTLAPDYWYLRGFDPKAMEPYVDFFGFMSYDLHGSWDADVKTLGSLVRPQTDIREIANDSVPLFFDGLDPAKINFGLASYGRGYTLASSSCAYFGCPFSGPSKPMPCTAFAGVASNTEIKNIIAQKGLIPELVPDTMVKQITWDDQWIGYDDNETYALKLGWADSHCFGGTMTWSIDMDSGSGSGDIPDGGASNNGDPGGNGGAGGAAGVNGQGQGNEGSFGLAGSAGANHTTTNVYIDPSIWNEQNPVVMCHPPCQLILPPFPIEGEGAIITLGSLTTTLNVENNVAQTTIASGVEQVINQYSGSILTTTISVPPLSASQMAFYGVNVTDSSSELITPTASIDIPVFSITQTEEPNGPSSSSTSSGAAFFYVTPPPYPWNNIDNKPPPGPPPPPLPSVPTITFKPGEPGPLCKSGCGRACVVFCSGCGFFGCGGCGLLGCGSNDQQIVGGDDDNPDDRGGPVNEEEEDQDEEEEECQLRPGGNGGGGGSDGAASGTPSGVLVNGPDPPSSEPTSAPSPTISIAPAPPPPVPSPPPPPEPPAPNPDTEKLHCYDTGSVIGRGTAINIVNDFCGPDYWGGTKISENRYIR